MLYNYYMNRHEVRVQIVFALYQHLLLNKDLKVSFSDNFENQEDFINIIEENLIIHEDEYINDINEHLNKWTFDRLNYVDQAILLESYAEIKTELNNKKIVIDEAINIAKEYCDDDAYKYINGVLDNL